MFYSLSFFVVPLLVLSRAASVNSTHASSNSPVMGTTERKALSNWDETKSNLLETHREELQDRLQKRCDQLTQRIEERIEKFEANKDKHIEYYNNLKDRITDIVQKLSDKGYDVEELALDLQTLDSMILDYASEYVKFIDLLKATREVVCGESQGAFADAVKAARDQLRVVFAARLGIREFYKDEIREDIKDLRQQRSPVSDSGASNEVVNEEVE